MPAHHLYHHSLLVESKSQVGPRLQGRGWCEDVDTEKWGSWAPPWSLSATVHLLPQMIHFLPRANVVTLLPKFSGVSSHYNINSKSKISSSKSGLSVDDTSGWNQLSTAPGKYSTILLLLWTCESRETIYLPIPPNMQWWDRLRVIAIDVSGQKEGKWQVKRSCQSIAVLKSSRANVGSSLINFQDLGIILHDSWLFLLEYRLLPLSQIATHTFSW